MKHKICTLLISCIMLIGHVGCAAPSTNNGKLVIWAASGAEKLMKETDYTARHNNKTLTINAFQNEYESAQIMLTPDRKIHSFDVKTEDLRSTDGTVLPQTAFELYLQKYINVGQVKDSNSPTGPGQYPDALLPLQTAVAYGENTVDRECNQGIWVTLHVPATQKGGIYTGKFTVTADDKDYDVPVSVTVYSYKLDDEVHSKSSFGLYADEIAWGEFDSTEEMYDAYYTYFLDYRISPQHLPGNDLSYVVFTEETLAKFLSYAKRSSLDPRCSHYNIPFNIVNASLPGGKAVLSVDFQQFKQTLIAMAEYGAKEKVNLFAKAGTYFIFFDEYDLNDKEDEAVYNLNAAYKLCEDLAVELAGTLECEPELKTQMLASLARLKHKVVGSYTDGFDADKAQFVPTIDKYNTARGRQIYTDYDFESYGNEGELWTYTCCYPRIPYSTYHTEDILLSARLLSWMMYEYDIVGNLYWNSSLYSWRKSSFGDLQLQDYYDTALRFPDANGDGYLVYPGRPYGIYGPVGTIRLQAIRDGNEEYDLFYALEELYTANGVSSGVLDAILGRLREELYSGAVVRIREGLVESFNTGREALAGLLMLAENTGTVIESYRIESGKAMFTISSDPAMVLKTADGDTLDGRWDNGRLVYTIEIPLENAQNSLSLTAEKDGSAYTLVLPLGGKNIAIDGASFASAFTMTTGGTAEEGKVEDEVVTKLMFDAAEKLSAQVEVDNLNVTAAESKIILRLYLYGSSNLVLEIRAKSETSSVYDIAATATLTPGWNEIEIATAALVNQSNDRLQVLRFNPSGTAAVSFALGNLTIVG